MIVAEARAGRVFVIRLEDGDILHECLENLAREKGVRAASVIAVGGADEGSHLVVGPRAGRETPIEPMETVLENVHEVCGTGTIFPDEKGEPVLHMHLACGRETNTITGCVRRGVRVWHVLEVIMYEITDTRAQRVKDATTGFALLSPHGAQAS